ncbi:hypothetical protein C1H46_024331 [Malus baccata]|uniref:Bet v I/Major latex protein domain-containing protein n=1 Tax=Malus baccata TaxID=106549 RepID=A0A540LUA9_MALBA|nr:hypothetical protein C1H46_024331 [Malus baccata]
MSSDCGKLEADVEIKASAAKFHEMFTHKPHHISNASNRNIQGCDLHEGDWGTVGSVVYWNYFHGHEKWEGKRSLSKLETVVEIKASAAKFHEMFTHKPHHISNASNRIIQGCDLHEGDWGTVGSVVYWNYFYGKTLTTLLQLISTIILFKGRVRNFFLSWLTEINAIKSYVYFFAYIKLYGNQYKRTTIEYKLFSKS